jgi:hypothetical protein
MLIVAALDATLTVALPATTVDHISQAQPVAIDL